jgi:hypothetical protein
MLASSQPLEVISIQATAPKVYAIPTSFANNASTFWVRSQWFQSRLHPSTPSSSSNGSYILQCCRPIYELSCSHIPGYPLQSCPAAYDLLATFRSINSRTLTWSRETQLQHLQWMHW